MRSLARLGVVATLLLSSCAANKSPATDSGPAKTDGGAEPIVEAESAPIEAPVEPDDGKTCKSDSDCVPAECCHPASCVIASAAPDCSDVACTDHCEGGTLDCGQGHCACQDGTCAAVMGGW